MSESWNHVIKYFQAPANYYWQWVEGGHVIEWREGETICYRDELLGVLNKLSRDGWPPLGSMLLVLSACREKAGTAAADNGVLYAALRLLDFFEKNRPELQENQNKVIAAIRFLQNVAALPAELRSGSNRIWLLYVIFKNATAKIRSEQTAQFLNVFNSGTIDHKIFGTVASDEEPAATTQLAKAFRADVDWLQQAANAFPTLQQLELLARTGVSDLPDGAELELPLQETGDLLEQLEQDPDTTGLAQLTRRLVAALNIPMHAHGSSDQLFGGVSDITNRGNFDRLLLSELAHDDLSLMARLANNEALYLRREELPSNPEKNRILLIDTTIKMWGLPRVFGIAAALACARNNKAKARILSYTLAANSFTEVDLATKAGVSGSLEKLDAALHCGRALTLFMDQTPVGEEDEVFLITEEEAIHNALLQSILSSLKKPVNFLVTVNRNGQLQFYEYIKGRRKLLSEARFDLQQLLFHTNKKKRITEKKKERPDNLPEIMRIDPCPLYFPTSKIKYNTDCFYELKKDQVFCVTIDQRVLYWDRRTRGAREIIEHLEPGRFCFGSIDGSMIYIFLYAGSTRYCRLYEVNLETNYVEITKLPETLNQVTEMAFYSGRFYIKANNNLFSIEPGTGTVYPVKDELSDFNEYLQEFKSRPTNLSYFKRLVNDGYTTINTVKSVYINGDGELGFDDRHISLRRHSGMIIIDHNREYSNKNKNVKVHNAKEVNAPAFGSAYANLKFSRFVWADGSEALADSRGFLHLRSSDKTIPEITMVMVMGKATACWAADGRVCGLAYFTGMDNAESKDVTGFYYNYIQRFIDTLEKHGTITEV